MRSSGRFADVRPAATSGPGATGCSPTRSGTRPGSVRELYAAHLPRDAGGRVLRGRRVPLPRARHRLRRGGGGRGGGHRLHLPPRRVCAAVGSIGRNSRPWRRTSPRSRRSASVGSASASPPTPCARARATGSRRSAATRRRMASSCTSTPTSSRARSRSASPSTDCGRSSSSPRPGASASGRPSSTRRTRTAPSSTCSATVGSRICVCPTTEADLGDGFLPVGACPPPRDRALHRLRLERPHRSVRGAPRARRASRGGRRVAAACSRPTSCGRSARTIGAAVARARRVGRHRGRRRAPLARRRRAGAPPGSPRRRLRGRRGRRRRLRTAPRADGTPDVDGRHRADLRRCRAPALARGARRRRLLGRVVRPVSRARARARGRGRRPWRCRRARQGRRRLEPGARVAVRGERDPGRQGVPRRTRRQGVRRRAVAAVRLGLHRRPPRASASGRARRRAAGVRRAARGRRCARRRTTSSGRSSLIVDAVPVAGHQERDRLREVAVALFEQLGQDDPVASSFRRRLASALY